MPLRGNRFLYALLFSVLLLVPGGTHCRAQFKSQAFSQSFNDDSPAEADTTDKIFNFKEFCRGISHNGEAECKTMFEGSLLAVGGMQIYNKDYWKLPIVYAGIGAGVASGIYFSNQGNKTASTLGYVGAGLFYWGSLMDGVINYKPDDYPSPAKATLYSLLLPGLGQIYNHELWKLPIYLGGIGGSVYYYNLYRKNYLRFQSIMRSGDTKYVQTSTSKYYRDLYRRYRDYSVLAICGFYLLQVIDANVFAYMHNFEITEDISLFSEPVVIAPDSELAFSPLGSAPSWASGALGMSIGIRF